MNYPSKLSRGTVLDERYKVERKIGEGGMSCVYLAEDLKLSGKNWAVKETVFQPGMLQQLQAEAEMLTRLNHVRLPRIVDFFQPDDMGYTYLVMDYIHGMTLDKYLRAYRGQLHADFILQLAYQVLDVLAYLHSHEPPIVFRDLKPSNIMLDEEMEVRLIDFGIARSYKRDQEEDTVNLGTMGFAAPEQYGEGQSDARTDLYGLGALLLYLVTDGKYSAWFPGVESYFRKDISSALPPVIRKLLQNRPDMRYQTAAEVVTALDTLKSEEISSSVSNKPRFIGTLVTAVLGVSPGIGTTHTCIALGHYLARQYRRVAIVEMGPGPTAFTRIQEIAQGSSPGAVRKFTVNGIEFWRQTSRGDVIALITSGYDAVVLDLGSFRDHDRLEEFLRADVPIVVGSAAEWRQHDLITLTRMLARHDQPNRIYAVPLASENAIQKLRKALGVSRIVALPLQTDPFDVSKETIKAAEVMYRDFLPHQTRKRRLRFAWG